MENENQSQIYQYNLTIVSIKMQVNFPCKMKIQHNSISITTQISSAINAPHKFLFNQQISIKEDNKKPSFQLQVALVTQKGAKYTAGVVKLFHSQLVKQQGSKIAVALTRCLDKQATCEIKIQKVTKARLTKRPILTSKLLNKKTLQMDDNRDFSPNQRFPTHPNIETKSQFQFPINNNRIGKNEWDTKSRQMQLSFYQRNPSKSPISKSNNRSRLKTITNQKQSIYSKHQEQSNRDKIIQAQVYKEGYIKLKEKFKKQTETSKNQLNKRIQLQNSQNNLKLQIMRYKLRSQQQQKNINQKNIRIKELQNKIITFQQKQIQIQYLKDQSTNKDHSIRVLQDTIRSLNQQNHELKSNHQDRHSSEIQKIKQLKHQLQFNKHKYQSRVEQIQKQLKSVKHSFQQLQKQLHSKSFLLEKQSLKLFEQQKLLSSNHLQHERQVQKYKSSYQQLNFEKSHEITSLTKEVSQVQVVNKQLCKEMERLKSNLLKSQFQKRLVCQQNQSICSQYKQTKQYKQKYSQLLRTYKNITQQKLFLQKKIQKIIYNKLQNNHQINHQLNQQIQYYKRINRQLQDKNKTLSNRIVQIQGQSDIIRNASDKVRRNHQNALRELAQSKEKEKNAKKTLRTKQQEILANEVEHSTIRQKMKNIDQINKLQTDKLKDQIERLKNDLQNEAFKASQLSQSNGQLSIQVSNMRIKLQYTQQRVQKEVQALKSRSQHLQNVLSQSQSQISSLQQSLYQSTQLQSQLTSSIHILSQQLSSTKELLNHKQRQFKVLEEKFGANQNVVMANKVQIGNLQYEIEQERRKIKDLEEDNHRIKQQISINNNQKIKNIKIITIYQDDLKKYKIQQQKLTINLNSKQKQNQEKTNQLKKLKQQFIKAQMKYSAFHKQSDRFKQGLVQVLNNSFLTILSNQGDILTVQTDRFNGKPTQNKGQIKLSNQVSASQVSSMIISNSKDIKVHISRLNQKLQQSWHQIQQLKHQCSLNTNQYKSSSSQQSQTIYQLQQQISSLLAEKQQQSVKNQHQLRQLQNQLNNRQHQIKQLIQEVQSRQTVINNLREEIQTNNQSSKRKITQCKKQKSQCQQKLQQLSHDNIILNDNLQRANTSLDQCNNQIKSLQQDLSKQNRQFNLLQQQSLNQQKQIQQLKSLKIQQSSKIFQLQLHLTSQTQLKNKNLNLLNQEEHKSMEFKNSYNNLIKQKENLLRTQIQNTQKMHNLQTKIIMLQNDIQTIQKQNLKLKSTLEQSKQHIKTLNSKINDIQLQVQSLKNDRTRLCEKQKQKQRQIQSLNQLIKSIQIKHFNQIQKLKQQKNNLQQQIQQKQILIRSKTLEINQKTLTNQRVIHQKQNKILGLQNKIIQLEEELFGKKQTIHKSNTINTNKIYQIEELKAKLQQLNILNQQLSNQLTVKDQRLMQNQSHIYNLQLAIESKDIQMNDKLQALQNECSQRQQSIIRQYQQRLLLVQRQQQYLKQTILQKQQQLIRIKNESKTLSLQQLTIKRTLQQKIRKLQQDRLSLFTLKSSQIQKLSQDLKQQGDTLKQKQMQYRRIMNQLQIARSSLVKMQDKNKQTQDKIKSINKIYNNQLQTLRKKQQAYKNYKELVSNQQWNMERQIKKVIQTFMKKFLQTDYSPNQRTNNPDQRNNKLIQLIKSLESTVVDSISNKFQEQ